jgi:hypothetical protein
LDARCSWLFIISSGGLVTPAFAPVDTSLMLTMKVGFVVSQLKAAGVTMSTQTYLRCVGDHSVTVYDAFTDEERTVTDIAAVVLATSREPYDPLTDELDSRVKQLFTIGDALAARPMAAATYEGQMFARYIGEPDAPTNSSDAYWPEPDRELLPQPGAVLTSSWPAPISSPAA